LYVKATDHRPEGPIDIKNTPHFVCCDAHHLPFRDKSFETVYSKALLEHVDYPTTVLKEMLRVARNRVRFIVPHRFIRGQLRWGNPKPRELNVHKTIFNRGNMTAWLNKIVGKENYEMEITKKSYPDFYFFFLHINLFCLPRAIHVTINKNGRKDIKDYEKPFLKEGEEYQK